MDERFGEVFARMACDQPWRDACLAAGVKPGEFVLMRRPGSEHARLWREAEIVAGMVREIRAENRTNEERAERIRARHKKNNDTVQ